MSGARDPLAEIRRLYFNATRETIQRDFARAIDLLKSLGSEEERERATVFMEGLSEMRAEWGAQPAAAERGTARKAPGRSKKRKTPQRG